MRCTVAGSCPDIREQIFREHMERKITAVIKAEAAGTLSGIQRARDLTESQGLFFLSDLQDGDSFYENTEVAWVTGNPFLIAQAEEVVIGTLSKSSGIATMARQALLKAGSRFRIVSGGWKKMPRQIKDLVRQAVLDGGIQIRITDKPFVYLDKNYVRILGGVSKALQAVASLGRITAIQIRGETGTVEEEAIEAAYGGAAIVMVDTGRREHLVSVNKALRNKKLRSQVEIAFAGNISLDDIESLHHEDVDVVDIGYAILDAPCLPMRFDVTGID